MDLPPDFDSRVVTAVAAALLSAAILGVGRAAYARFTRFRRREKIAQMLRAMPADNSDGRRTRCRIGRVMAAVQVTHDQVIDAVRGDRRIETGFDTSGDGSPSAMWFRYVGKE